LLEIKYQSARHKRQNEWPHRRVIGFLSNSRQQLQIKFSLSIFEKTLSFVEDIAGNEISLLGDSKPTFKLEDFPKFDFLLFEEDCDEEGSLVTGFIVPDLLPLKIFSSILLIRTILIENYLIVFDYDAPFFVEF
jgi:hypothetical protein